MAIRVGHECVIEYLYDSDQDTTDIPDADASFTEITKARDVTIDLSGAEITAATRAAAFNRRLVGTRSGSITFDMNRDYALAAYTPLQTAFLAKHYVWFRVLDTDFLAPAGEADGTGSGWQVKGYITNMSPSEPFNDLATTSVTVIIDDEPTLITEGVYET